jgi:hypothetical protein
MKIILSRKGFDSSFGKIPSPILPDGTLVSLPIPDDSAPITYADIDLGSRSAAELLNDLRPSGYRHKGDTRPRQWANVRTHLDPDLRMGALHRLPGWRPLFGQDGAAQSHLDANGVGVGGLFLFFGWFRRTEQHGGRLRYVPDEPDLHVIFGWLQIGDVWRVSRQALPEYARYHPHAGRESAPRNTIDAAAADANGGVIRWRAGAFARFDPRLQLTAPGASRSVWRLPAWFYPDQGKPPLSYHEDQRRWKRGEGHVILESTSPGQEFVLDADPYPEALAWAEEILSIPSA